MTNLNNPWDDQDNKNPGKENKGNNKKAKDILEEILRNSQESFSKLMNEKSRKGGGNNDNSNPGYGFFRKLVLSIASVIFGVWLLSGFYTIQPEEEGVILFLGKYSRTTYPGLSYKLPYPFERLEKVGVTRVNKEEIGFRSKGFGSNGKDDKINIPQESQMLTGDENIIDIDFDVQWRIKNAKQYLFNVHDLKNENTVKTAAESAMREAMGLAKINDALAEERLQIEQKAKKILQNILDSYEMGIEIQRLQMLRVEPPSDVIDAYRDVQSAKADRERDINRAYTYRNDVVPKAKGEASQILQEAEGYKKAVVAKARGSASRFSAVYNEYVKAKDVTKRRMYWEAISNIMKDTKKLVVDSKTATMPLLGLQDLFAKKPIATNATPVDNNSVTTGYNKVEEKQ